MERKEALRRIKLLVGRDLRPLADEYNVTVWRDGRKNKGWAGQVIERYLGFAYDTRQAPDFGTWDLKLVALAMHRDGTLRVKESMAITMITEADLLSLRFEDSHLYDKMRRLLVVGRVYENVQETSSLLHSAAEFDLDTPAVYGQVKADYDLIKETARRDGFDKLTGDLGELVQVRTKGRGHGSRSRAFYVRAHFVARILNLNSAPASALVIAQCYERDICS